MAYFSPALKTLIFSSDINSWAQTASDVKWIGPIKMRAHMLHLTLFHTSDYLIIYAKLSVLKLLIEILLIVGDSLRSLASQSVSLSGN